MLDLKLLETFREVATRGSFSAAAEALSFTQPAATQPRDGLELGLGIRETREDHVGVTDERATRLGEPDAARGAVHEPRPGLALEGGDLLADGRLGVGERLGGGGEGAARRDLPEDPETLDVEHQPSLSPR